MPKLWSLIEACETSTHSNTKQLDPVYHVQLLFSDNAESVLVVEEGAAKQQPTFCNIFCQIVSFLQWRSTICVRH